jgi:hypothetical protein
MAVLLTSLAAVAVSSLIAAGILVTVASKREDKAWSLGKPPRGPVDAIARRILDFHSDDPELPQPKSRVDRHLVQMAPRGQSPEHSRSYAERAA